MRLHAAPGLTHILKTDDDSYVNLPTLVRLLRVLPTRSLYAGADIGAGSQVLTQGKNAESAALHTLLGGRFPSYMSGAGYLLSADVAGVVSAPAPLRRWVNNEDAAVGLQLLPFNITRIRLSRLIFANGIPTGRCFNPKVVLLVHYASAAYMQACPASNGGLVY